MIKVFDRFLAQEPNEDDVRELPLYLCKWLQQATGQPVIILIDEYDTPIHSAWDGGYYEEMIDFMRSFLSSACKDNPHLHKAVLTGILRVAKELIFSGMNNLAVCSIDSRAIHMAFGFTEEEVQELLYIKGLEGRLDEVRHWYNGYRFGPERTVIYNPWSLLNFVSKPRDGLIPYWVNFFEDIFVDLLEDILSFHDVAGEPEKVYHAIFLGMLMWFEPWFQIRSHRESGYGGYDLALYPKDSSKVGWVIEFKRARARRGETLTSMTANAMDQMKNKKYASDIIAQGCGGVSLVAIAFRGKDHMMSIEEVS
jgi:hypothetical protein